MSRPYVPFYIRHNEERAGKSRIIQEQAVNDNDAFNYRLSRTAPKSAFDGGFGSSRRVDPYADPRKGTIRAFLLLIALFVIGTLLVAAI